HAGWSREVPISHRRCFQFDTFGSPRSGHVFNPSAAIVAGGRHPHYLGLRNFRMNWSVCPRIVGSNTMAVRGSAGLARTELSESNLNPAASTSRRTVEG